METSIMSPMKWHGGKTFLAKRIIDLMPDHTHYVEPFFGGGAVLFAKPPELIERHSEVVNDIYGELSNFWRALQSASLFPEIHRRVSMTPLSKEVWEEAINATTDDPLERAVSFFIRYRQSRQGLGDRFATMSRKRTRCGMNEQVSSWLSGVERLAEAHDRLKRVVIFNEDALTVIRREDEAITFFYLDPPYLPQTRVKRNAYVHEMSEEQHVQLLNLLGSLQGKFLLSGYPHPLYECAAKTAGWRCEVIEIANNASGKKVKPRMRECLWMNY